MARSGQYHGSRLIEHSLLSTGYTEEVRRLFNRWTRSELDRICQRAIEQPNRAHDQQRSAGILSLLRPARPATSALQLGNSFLARGDPISRQWLITVALNGNDHHVTLCRHFIKYPRDGRLSLLKCQGHRVRRLNDRRRLRFPFVEIFERRKRQLGENHRNSGQGLLEYNDRCLIRLHHAALSQAREPITIDVATFKKKSPSGDNGQFPNYNRDGVSMSKSRKLREGKTAGPRRRLRLGSQAALGRQRRGLFRSTQCIADFAPRSNESINARV